jgi:Zn-dependent peptidase ImmA (M78 family)/transcriptional regulator with XRE-family HTH domain
MASIRALVKPELLKWARTSANLEPLAAARKINVPDGRVTEWEQGEVAPTIAELRRAAAVYHRALGVLFLSEPPLGFETLRDFRRIGGTPAAIWSSGLHAEYRRAHWQREALLDLAELDGVATNSEWRLQAFRQTANVSVIADMARTALHSSAPIPAPNSSSSVFDHLNYWSTALESMGVLVMTTEGGGVDVDEMRAFSLYFDEIPVIVLNGADWPRGRVFSLLHEYAHLCLHTAGLCDTRTDWRPRSEDRRLEAQCNAIAAEVLMPDLDVVALEQVQRHEVGTDWSIDELVSAAKAFGVSAEALLRRLVTLHLATRDEYEQFRQHNAAPSRKGSGGGNFYYTKVRNLGRGYVRAVTGAHSRALIDTTTAATYLDAKVDQMDRLAAAAQVPHA